jgi:hypothetical protein
MDMFLVRRRLLAAPPAPFKCSCGRPVCGWDTPFNRIARCANCERPEYHLLRPESEVTESGDATELVIVARGIVLKDKGAFEQQGFRVRIPAGAVFFPDVPTLNGELTNPDGTLR